ncbi:hypothetical protein ACROYT_G013744 [Oculina patagonica]
MGSPVSAVIAELVMQEVEEKALETPPVQPKWWRRYVDDSNACIKRDGVEAFHSHSNSINANIQFTVEMPTTTMGKNSIAFLDTNNTVRRSVIFCNMLSELEELDKSRAWPRLFQRLNWEASQKAGALTAARLPENRQLNRYRDVLPYDHSRIILKEGSPDFINANLVEITRLNKKYILTQPKLSHSLLGQPPLQPAPLSHLPTLSRSTSLPLHQTSPAGISTVISAVAPTANSFTSAVTKVVAAPIPVLSAQKEYCNNLSPSLSHLPPSTPVCIPNLAQELKHYPDRQFASDLLHDLQFGCRIGYQGPRHHRITPNLKSTLLHPEAVTEALQKEISRGHTAGPFSSLPLPTLQCSPLGVVPKKDGSWRIIMDLSSPRGSSINDFISKEDYTLHYASFDQALSLVASFGTGALMAKLDLKHAFRLCPVSPMDRDLLGMHWQGKFYVHLRLPFGLRSSPFLFNRLADAFEWILKNNYAISALMHYLDDYFTVGPPLSPSCASQVQTMVKTADRLGIPLAPDKLAGPTTQLVFLGILIDSNLMECSLPPDKLSELLAELQAWSSCKKCIKRELLSLIGKLNFACRIIPAGRIFLRRLIDLSTTARLPHHHISLNVEARRDVAWWLKFLPLWNGRAIIPDPFWSRSPDLELFTDASGGLGFGIYFQGHWLNGSWPPNLADRSIQWKELYPIALACLLWGPLWRGKKLLFHCDNQSVVDIWAKGSSHAPLPPTRPSGRLGSDGSSPLSQDPLDGRLAFLQSQAIAPSTRRAYQAGIRRYSTFCYSRQWDPFPASELQLRYFASWLSDQVSFPTIKLYLAGIRYAHIENRLTDPFADAPLLHLLLRGIKRTNGLSSRRRLPITMSVMRQLKGALSADPQFASQDKLMLWSAFTLAFFGFLRSSEFTSPSSTYFNSLVHLSHSDISFTSDGSLTMQLKASKTDPFRKGCSIKLAPSGRSVCAVRAMHRYLAHQPSRSATPLYLFSTGQFLTRDKVTSILRILLQRLGFATERYASHSFRIGAATTAAEAGLPPGLSKPSADGPATATPNI